MIKLSNGWMQCGRFLTETKLPFVPCGYTVGVGARREGMIAERGKERRREGEGSV